MIVSNRTYDEISIGDSASSQRTCTRNDLILFAHASGNINPLVLPGHKQDGDSAIVAPGMWTGALVSEVLGNQLPGAGALYVSQTLNFHGRVHIGDEVTVTVTVIDKKPDLVLELKCEAVKDDGELIAEGIAEIIAPTEKLEADDENLPGMVLASHPHFKRLIDACESLHALPTAVVAPDDESSLGGAILAAKQGLINPILIGSRSAIESAAKKTGADISGYELVEAETHSAAAAKAVAMVHEGHAKAVMKGHVHSDELLLHVTKRDGGLRTTRRISHVFVMDVPGRDRLMSVTDAAINIAPNLEAKVDIVQNAIELAQALGNELPRVSILSAVEVVNPKIPSTLDAAILSKMADRGQIRGGLVDGPLAMDNAIDAGAASTKGITSMVAGQAEILVAPNLEAGNMLAKELTFIGHAEAAGLVIGAKVPVILTSRADSEHSRLVSCAIALLYNEYKKTGKSILAKSS